MKLQTLNSSVLENLEPMLNESIYHFLVEFQKGRTDFSELGSIFFRLIQTMTHPPLEFIWFYSALTYHTSKSSTHKDSHNFFLIAKDLYHSLVSFCSPFDNYLKQVSLLAPVLYQLVSVKCEISSFKTEIEGLVEAIVGHIIMCCCNDLGEQEVGFGKSKVSWVGLVPVWIVDQVGGNHGCVNGLKLFFPLSTDDIRREIDVDCGMANLAGVVMIESFLLRLCLWFDLGASSKELPKDLRSHAVQIIKGFKKNSAFLVMLFKLLLEPSLPVAELLTTTDELLLRKLLFDVTLDSGWFDNSHRLSDVHYKEIVILWLFVTNSALQFASENNDHTRVQRYLEAFFASPFPGQIIMWVTSQRSTSLITPDISSPDDLINWLLVLEEQGLKVCEQSISALHLKAVNHKSKVQVRQEREESMVESLEEAPTRINGRRKRDTEEEVQMQIKILKYTSQHNLADDAFHTTSEVGNSVPDQEMVDMVR